MSDHWLPEYHPREEKWNVLTHGFGLLLSIPALVLLIIYSCKEQGVWHIIGFSIYGITLVVLYLASTLYHSSKNVAKRRRLMFFDHIAIFFLIAGTYTPFLLVTLRGPWGWSLLAAIWGLAIVGAVLKFFFMGRYDRFFTLLYLLMGWLVLIALYPLIQKLAFAGLVLVFAGGISYSAGAVFYRFERLHFNHSIFHLFVLLGSIFHFLAIFMFV